VSSVIVLPVNQTRLFHIVTAVAHILAIDPRSLIMRTGVATLAAVLLTVFEGAMARAPLNYNIIPRSSAAHRPDHRELQAPSATPKVISFDGDLDRIIALALERANGASSAAPTTSPAPTATISPTITPAPTMTALPTNPPVHPNNVCEGAILNRLEIYTWAYTIETVPNADTDAVIGEVEEILQERLIPLLLECFNAEALNATIVAIDATLPRDTISVDSTFVLPIELSDASFIVQFVTHIEFLFVFFPSCLRTRGEPSQQVYGCGWQSPILPLGPWTYQ
jgi:hypothetical protein